jgi:hypothetical protein
MMADSAIDERWARELEELAGFATRCGGRLQFGERPDGLVLKLRCRSPIRLGGSEPVVTEVEHEIRIIRPVNWPASPLIAQHLAPKGLVHGNVLDPKSGRRSLLPAPNGLICYANRWSPTIRLTVVVQALYDLLAFRNDRYATSSLDCLNREAVIWTNETKAKDPTVFPTDTRPLVALDAAADAGNPEEPGT